MRLALSWDFFAAMQQQKWLNLTARLGEADDVAPAMLRWRLMVRGLRQPISVWAWKFKPHRAGSETGAPGHRLTFLLIPSLRALASHASFTGTTAARGCPYFYCASAQADFLPDKSLRRMRPIFEHARRLGY
jgi:hypothetical protein